MQSKNLMYLTENFLNNTFSAYPLVCPLSFFGQQSLMIFPYCANILVMTTLSLSKRSGLTWGTPSTIITVSTPSDTLGFFKSTSPSNSKNKVMIKKTIKINWLKYVCGQNVSNIEPISFFFPSPYSLYIQTTIKTIFCCVFFFKGGPPIRRVGNTPPCGGPLVRSGNKVLPWAK